MAASTPHTSRSSVATGSVLPLVAGAALFGVAAGYALHVVSNVRAQSAEVTRLTQELQLAQQQQQRDAERSTRGDARRVEADRRASALSRVALPLPASVTSVDSGNSSAVTAPGVSHPLSLSTSSSSRSPSPPLTPREREATSQPPATPLDAETSAFVLSSGSFGLSRSDLQRVLPFLVTQRFPGGSYLFQSGEPSDACYIVVRGSVQLLMDGRVMARFGVGRSLGEIGMIEKAQRRACAQASEDTTVAVLTRAALYSPAMPAPLLTAVFSYLGSRVTSLIRGHDFYAKMDVLLVQDGGCAPGYDSVAAFLAEYFERQRSPTDAASGNGNSRGRQVFVAQRGFSSLVRGGDDDFCALVHDSALFARLSPVPRVFFAPELRNRRGASFRSERYPQFVQEELQRQAAANIAARGVRTLVAIGGNGTMKGIFSLRRFLPPSVRCFFIPVTIDSDIGGTECIGQHTAVEVGAEQLRCFLGDAHTHHRVYLLEMMGREGGYHALFSALGAGADLAVMPNSQIDLPRLARTLDARQATVIAVAEGYGVEDRKAAAKSADAAERAAAGSASTWLYHQLLATGELPRDRKVVCEPFTRCVRGAAPANMDTTLAQRMAAAVVEMDARGESGRMPTVNAEAQSSLPFDRIDTDNTVNHELVLLTDHLGVHLPAAEHLRVHAQHAHSK